MAERQTKGSAVASVPDGKLRPLFPCTGTTAGGGPLAGRDRNGPRRGWRGSSD